MSYSRRAAASMGPTPRKQLRKERLLAVLEIELSFACCLTSAYGNNEALMHPIHGRHPKSSTFVKHSL
jgi:hypothetical protein